MRIQKLNWAGLQLFIGDKTVVVDAVEDFSYYKPILGDAVNDVLRFGNDLLADYVLFTHLHYDHFDGKLIRNCLKPQGKIIVWQPLLELARGHFEDLDIRVLETNESFTEAGTCFKPVFAMDGIGDLQCSWIIEANGVRVFHGGDTIWHNQFWKLGKENGPIDFAFLPVNGVTVNFPMIGLTYSTVPASMTLEQAFNAARLLNAHELVPIHYELFEHPVHYVPRKFSPAELEELKEKTGQNYRLLADGTFLE